MQNIKHLLWSLIFTVLLSIPSFAIMGIKAPGPAVEPGNPSKVISATHADTADSSSVLNPLKVSGVPSVNFFYEANSTDTNGNGWIGPTNATKNIFLKLEDETASVGQTLVVSNIAIDQTINTPIGNITADIWTLITGESSAAVSDDAYSSTWDGVTTIGASKNAIYDKISALETQVSDMIAAFSAAGLNSFSFDPVTTFPLYSNTATPAVSVDVTDTSTTYAVASVLYKIDAGEYAGNTMTNTVGNTWAATLSTLSEGSHDIRFQASDDKSTPNTGESAAYTGAIVVDLTNPVVGAITPSSLTHDGTGATLTATVASVTEANEDDREWSLYDVTDAAIEVAWTTFTGLSITGITIPADQHTYRLDVRCTDLAGNVGSASSSNIVYEAVASSIIDLDFEGATESDRLLNGATSPVAVGGATTDTDHVSGSYCYDTNASTTGLVYNISTMDMTNFTIELHFKMPTWAASDYIYQIYIDTNNSVSVQTRTDHVECVYRAGGVSETLVTSAGSTVANTWYTLKLHVTGGVAYWYLNGALEEQESVAGTWSGSPTNIYFGVTAAGTSVADILIDDVVVE